MFILYHAIVAMVLIAEYGQEEKIANRRSKTVGEQTLPLITCMLLSLLRRHGDHYEWNKAVTCIHNVLTQQRYLEHYGEVIIRNLKSSVCTCKITFVKVSERTSFFP